MPIVECYVRFEPKKSKFVRSGLKDRGCRIDRFDSNNKDVINNKKAYVIKLKIKKGPAKKEILELFKELGVEKNKNKWFLEIRETGIKKFIGFLKDIFLRMIVIGSASFITFLLDFLQTPFPDTWEPYVLLFLKPLVPVMSYIPLAYYYNPDRHG